MAKRKFHWDPVNDCVMHETDGDGNTLVTYTREPSQYGPLISEHRNGHEYVHHYDALGSTTMLTDETGSVTDTFTYDAWGNEVARMGATETPYRWNGRWGYQYDEPTGSYYVRARTYQPTIARWVSVDSFADASDVSLYVYVLNSGVTLLDASGLAEEPPLPQADDQWWITFTNGPTGLKNCVVGYRWRIVQHFKAKKPGPWKNVPTQTWQLNISTPQDALVAHGGECKTDKFNVRKLIDIQKFPLSTTPTHYKTSLPDILEAVKVVGLGDAVLCRMTEKVEKQLGFHDGKGSNLKTGTREPTDAEMKRMADMRGPFLFMNTTYVYKNPCGVCKEPPSKPQSY